MHPEPQNKNTITVLGSEHACRVLVAGREMLLGCTGDGRIKPRDLAAIPLEHRVPVQVAVLTHHREQERQTLAEIVARGLHCYADSATKRRIRELGLWPGLSASRSARGEIPREPAEPTYACRL